MNRLTVLASCAVVLLGAHAHAQSLSGNTIDARIKSEDLAGPARKIMRLSDGRIYASFDVEAGKAATPTLYAAPKPNAPWTDVSKKLAGQPAHGTASDTGPAGTYVAYVDAASKSGTVSRFPDPLGNAGEAAVYKELTPSGKPVTDTFVAASKGEESTNSVAYAWRDAATGTIYLGFSPDGLKFDKARAVVTDPHLASGPSLAVHNDYVLLSYLSSDESATPAGVAGSAYPVWLESWDAGKTWTKPQPVFGTRVSDFPKAEEVLRKADGAGKPEALFAAGGSRVAANSLAWAQAEIGARIFITSGQALVTKAGKPAGDGRAVAGIVSFKDLSDGPEARWQHVFASEYNPAPSDPTQPKNTAFQYSALPGSSIRAVAYLQQVDRKAGGGDRIAVSVSVNTGRSFDRTVKFDARTLGLAPGEPVSFTSSTCLLVKGDGDVYLDAAYATPRSASLRVAQLPLGVNVKNLPPSLFNVNARWP